MKNVGEKVNNDKVPIGYITAWSSRSISMAVNFMIMGYVYYYATDSLGLSAGLVGTLLLVSKIFGSFTDLIAGYIIDLTNTKLGKARPYELVLVPLWIFTVLIFSIPDMSTMWKAVCIFMLYTLINSVCITFLNGTDAIYMARSLKNENHRVTVLSVNGFLLLFFCVGVSIILPILIDMWGSASGGWTRIILIFAIPLSILGLARFFFIKEIVTEQGEGKQKQKVKLKESLLALKENKYIFMIAMGILLANLINVIGTSINIHYFSYIVGDISLLSIIGITLLITPLFMLFFPLLSKKLGTIGIVRMGIIIGIIGNIIKFFAGANLPLLIVGNLMAGISTVPLTIMVNTFLIDCMDYGEWKTGIRVEGLMTSVNNFSEKLGSGLASGGVGIIMGMAGYDGTLAVQSASAQFSIVALYSIIPAIFLGIILFVLHFYDLDKNISDIRMDLKNRAV